MFGRHQRSSAPSSARDISRRLQSLELRLERAGTQGASRAAVTSDHLTDAVAAALSSLAGRFRGVFGGDAAKIGDDVMHRLSKEVEHRPLLTLGVLVGVGILAGLIFLRR